MSKKSWSISISRYYIKWVKTSLAYSIKIFLREKFGYSHLYEIVVFVVEFSKVGLVLDALQGVVNVVH